MLVLVIHMTLVTFALLLVLQNQPAKASVEGFVVRAGTNEPISGSRVTISREGAGVGLFAVTTDNQGHFIIKDLDAGRYMLAAQRNGFARQIYGEKAVGRPGKPFNLASGQATKDIVFHLTPAGAVTGRVSDVSGEPLPSITVQLMRATYQADGQRKLVEVGSAQTNDRGEYRIFYVTPGRYFISAKAGRIMALLNGAVLQPSANQINEPGYPPTYYPGTSDPSTAMSIEVQAGTDLTAIDFALRKQDVFRIRGRVLDPVTNTIPGSVQVLIIPRNNPSVSFNFISTPPIDYNNTSGTFQIRDVLPGSYWVQAIFNPTSGQAPRLGLTAEVAVDVSESDVEGLTLAFTPGFSISGHLSDEDGTSIASLTDYRKIRVSLTSITPRGPLVPNLAAQPSADGTFHIDNLQPGDYKVSVASAPPGMYLKEVRLGQVDIMNGVSLSGPVAVSLEVLLSPKAGQITGTVVDSARNPVPGIEAVLVPAEYDRNDLYRTVISDQNGQFSIRSVSPGNYRLFAWEDIEPFSYTDPDFLRRYENQGISIKISESQNMMVEARLIPAGQ
jgi:hypothetical protein